MSDVLIFDNNQKIPEYSPGITGYGQKGSPGTKGKTGTSVYYSSYIMMENEDYDITFDLNKELFKKITNGEPLSNNNYLYNGHTIKYMDGDIIIDKTGNFFIIKEINYENNNHIIVSINKKAKEEYSEIKNTFNELSIRCITSFYKSSVNKWRMFNGNNITNLSPEEEGESDYYLQTADKIYSPKVYHSKKLEEDIFGNYISFRLNSIKNSTINNYTYKFVLVLPNGQLLEKISGTNTCTIFIENKLLMGCFDIVGWNNTFNFNTENTTLSTISKDVINKYRKIKELKIESPDSIISEKWGDLLKCQGGPYHKTYNNSIADKLNTILCSYFIKYNCKAYVEIYPLNNENNTSTYRIDASDFIDGESGSGEMDDMFDISPSEDFTIWDPTFYKFYVYNQSENVARYKTPFIRYTQGSNTYRFNPMNSFIFVPQIEDTFNDDLSILSETGIVYNAHFIGVDGYGQYTYESDRMDDGHGNMYNGMLFLDYGKGGDGFINTFKEFIEAYKNIHEDITIITNGNTKILPAFNKDEEETLTNLLNRLYDDESRQAAENEIRSRYGVFISSVSRNLHGATTDTGSPYDSEINDTYAPYIDFNRTVKLYFSNINYININIIYNKFKENIIHPDTGNKIEYSPAQIYIGYPDHPLIVSNDSSTNFYHTEDQTLKNGIYYLNKILPPGYTDSNAINSTDAGLADININLAAFNLDPYKKHYIEFGISLLDTKITADTPGATQLTIGNTRNSNIINAMHLYRLFKNNNGDDVGYYSFLGPNTSNDPEIQIYIKSLQICDNINIESDIEDDGNNENEQTESFTYLKTDFPPGS